jgi:DNA-binding transcriptional ArsR family regulator
MRLAVLSQHASINCTVASALHDDKHEASREVRGSCRTLQLPDREECSAMKKALKELAASFDMALPTFMQHLDVLEESGLVASEKSGRTRTYRLSPKPMQEVEGWMIAQRAIWDRRLNQLDTYLDKLHKSWQETPPTTP